MTKSDFSEGFSNSFLPPIISFHHTLRKPHIHPTYSSHRNVPYPIDLHLHPFVQIGFHRCLSSVGMLCSPCSAAVTRSRTLSKTSTPRRKRSGGGRSNHHDGNQRQKGGFSSTDSAKDRLMSSEGTFGCDFGRTPMSTEVLHWESGTFEWEGRAVHG